VSVKVVVYGDRIDLADELEEEFHAVAKDVVTEGAEKLLREVRALLRLRAGTFRTAAPEGQPPEYDVGDLFRSFRLIPARVRGRSVSAGIQSDDPGANRVEFGATDTRGIRTLPHPYLRPALANVEPLVTELFIDRFGLESVQQLSKLSAG